MIKSNIRAYTLEVACLLALVLVSVIGAFWIVLVLFLSILDTLHIPHVGLWTVLHLFTS